VRLLHVEDDLMLAAQLRRRMMPDGVAVDHAANVGKRGACSTPPRTPR
jgi:hypothetical protein